MLVVAYDTRLCDAVMRCCFLAHVVVSTVSIPVAFVAFLLCLHLSCTYCCMALFPARAVFYRYFVLLDTSYFEVFIICLSFPRFLLLFIYLVAISAVCVCLFFSVGRGVFPGPPAYVSIEL